MWKKPQCSIFFFLPAVLGIKMCTAAEKMEELMVQFA